MHYIIVKNQFIGFHRYLDAPEEVKFLKSWHRHLFTVRTKLTVDHSNREQEFFIIQKKIDKILDKYRDKQFEESCEQISEYVANHFDNALSVEVSEDEESVGGYIKLD